MHLFLGPKAWLWTPLSSLWPSTPLWPSVPLRPYTPLCPFCGPLLPLWPSIFSTALLLSVPSTTRCLHHEKCFFSLFHETSETTPLVSRNYSEMNYAKPFCSGSHVLAAFPFLGVLAWMSCTISPGLTVLLWLFCSQGRQIRSMLDQIPARVRPFRMCDSGADLPAVASKPTE
jgi:hypothetical protein